MKKQQQQIKIGKPSQLLFKKKFERYVLPSEQQTQTIDQYYAKLKEKLKIYNEAKQQQDQLYNRFNQSEQLQNSTDDLNPKIKLNDKSIKQDEIKQHGILSQSTSSLGLFRNNMSQIENDFHKNPSIIMSYAHKSIQPQQNISKLQFIFQLLKPQNKFIYSYIQIVSTLPSTFKTHRITFSDYQILFSDIRQYTSKEDFKEKCSNLKKLSQSPPKYNWTTTSGFGLVPLDDANSYYHLESKGYFNYKYNRVSPIKQQQRTYQSKEHKQPYNPTAEDCIIQRFRQYQQQKRQIMAESNISQEQNENQDIENDLERDLAQLQSQGQLPSSNQFQRKVLDNQVNFPNLTKNQSQLFFLEDIQRLNKKIKLFKLEQKIKSQGYMGTFRLTQSSSQSQKMIHQDAEQSYYLRNKPLKIQNDSGYPQNQSAGDMPHSQMYQEKPSSSSIKNLIFPPDNNQKKIMNNTQQQKFRQNTIKQIIKDYNTLISLQEPLNMNQDDGNSRLSDFSDNYFQGKKPTFITVKPIGKIKPKTSVMVGKNYILPSSTIKPNTTSSMNKTSHNGSNSNNSNDPYQGVNLSNKFSESKSLLFEVFIKNTQFISQNQPQIADRICKVIQLRSKKPQYIEFDQYLKYQNILVYKTATDQEMGQFLIDFFTLGSDKVDKDEFENLLLYITSSKDYKQKSGGKTLYQYYLDSFQRMDIIRVIEDQINVNRLKEVINQNLLNAQPIIELISGIY